MLSKLSKEQLVKIATHYMQIMGILTETCQPSDYSELETGISFNELLEISIEEVDGKDNPFREIKPQPCVRNYEEEERLKKEKALKCLCGRWTSGSNRCGIEISRAGEHFILTYLKRNGYPSDERYILIWLDGDILYYGHEHRITVLALDRETDKLMISPGADYTRVPKDEKR